MLFFCYIVSYIDRINISFAKLQMLDDLHFSSAAYGLGAGIFFVGFFIFELPSNLMLYRFGVRVWIARIMVTWGVLCSGMMFIKTPEAFYIMRFLFGAAEAGFLPGVVYYVAQWYPRERHGRIISLLITGAVVGGILGGPFAGVIMDTFMDVAGLRNWQWLFLLTGIPAVALGVAFYFLMPNKPSDLKGLNEIERTLLKNNLDADNAKADHQRSKIFDALKESKVWLLGLVALTVNLGIYGVVFWTPTIIKEAGFKSYTTIGLISTLPYVAAGMAMLFLGYSSDRWRERRWHIAFACIVGAAGMLISIEFKAVPMLSILGVIVATAGFIGSTPLVWAFASNFIKDKAAAAGFAIINSMGAIGGFSGPYLMGMAKDYTGNTDAALYVMVSFALLGSLIVLFLPRPGPAR
ncbi:MFS transporter [Glaciimonas sp. PAMC28666]|uniref:MFS transporter n=1 Tax=Glaciimonas sp. PAMC28666 TaxID=2807626 RepID=UPI001F03DAFC|nr:MFS transporter [Glaciimonas sp. PAMC28666]